jgi:DNA polymerase IV
VLTRRIALREPTDDGALLARSATDLLARAALREPVRLLGVGVTQLISADTGQLALFPTLGVRRERLNRALDAIADRFGSGAIVRGEAGHAARAGLSLQHKRGANPEDR